MGSGGYNTGNPARPDANGKYYWGFGGTSGACAFASGLAGLLIAHNSSLTANHVQAIIDFSSEETGIDSLLYVGRDPYYGYGLIDANEALSLSDKTYFLTKDNDAMHRASFSDKGHIIIEGSLTQSATGAQLTPASADSWIVKDDSANCVARVTSSGDMIIKGALTEYDPHHPDDPLALTNQIFVFRDTSDAVIGYIDKDGNLKLKGRAFVGADPDRSSSQEH